MPINSADTAWVLVSAAMVMLMTPGVAFFYGGMVRRKNFLSTLMMCFVTLGLIGLLWVLYGYSLSFGPDKAGVIGGSEFPGTALESGKPLPPFMPLLFRNWPLPLFR